MRSIIGIILFASGAQSQVTSPLRHSLPHPLRSAPLPPRKALSSTASSPLATNAGYSPLSNAKSLLPVPSTRGAPLRASEPFPYGGPLGLPKDAIVTVYKMFDADLCLQVTADKGLQWMYEKVRGFSEGNCVERGFTECTLEEFGRLEWMDWEREKRLWFRRPDDPIVLKAMDDEAKDLGLPTPERELSTRTSPDFDISKVVLTALLISSGLTFAVLWLRRGARYASIAGMKPLLAA